MSSNERICVFCSSSSKMDQSYYDAASDFGKWLGLHGKTLVYGGSRAGMMEVLSQSARDNGAKVFGVVPQKIVARDMVSDNIDITFYTDGLSDRKDTMMRESDIFVVLPGSIGTLDEAFSVMASNSFGEQEKKTVFWNVNGYWDDLFAMLDNMAPKGVVNKPYSEYMFRADSLEQLTAIIEGK